MYHVISSFVVYIALHEGTLYSGLQRATAVMSPGEVSFVDFLLTIPVCPDDPRYSCLMKRDSPSEPAGSETSFWISVQYGRYCSSGGDRPARPTSGVICSPPRLNLTND